MSEIEKQSTVTLLPSEKIIAAANEVQNVTDAKGRNITLKKPGILDQFDLIEVLGEAAANQVYRVMCIPLLYVAAIDGSPVMKISSNREMRALISLLDNHGFEAIREGIKKFGADSETGGDEEAVKK